MQPSPWQATSRRRPLHASIRVVPANTRPAPAHLPQSAASPLGDEEIDGVHPLYQKQTGTADDAARATTNPNGKPEESQICTTLEAAEESCEWRSFTGAEKARSRGFAALCSDGTGYTDVREDLASDDDDVELCVSPPLYVASTSCAPWKPVHEIQPRWVRYRPYEVDDMNASRHPYRHQRGSSTGSDETSEEEAAFNNAHDEDRNANRVDAFRQLRRRQRSVREGDAGSGSADAEGPSCKRRHVERRLNIFKRAGKVASSAETSSHHVLRGTYRPALATSVAGSRGRGVSLSGATFQPNSSSGMRAHVDAVGAESEESYCEEEGGEEDVTFAYDTFSSSDNSQHEDKGNATAEKRCALPYKKPNAPVTLNSTLQTLFSRKPLWHSSRKADLCGVVLPPSLHCSPSTMPHDEDEGTDRVQRQCFERELQLMTEHLLSIPHGLSTRCAGDAAIVSTDSADDVRLAQLLQTSLRFYAAE